MISVTVSDFKGYTSFWQCTAIIRDLLFTVAADMNDILRTTKNDQHHKHLIYGTCDTDIS